MNKKVIITIVAILILLTIVIVGIFIFTNDKEKTKPVKNTTKAITDSEIIKDETFGGLQFTNTTFIKEGDLYTLSIDVTNPSDNEINIEKVKIVMKDKDKKENTTLLGYIGSPMKAKETRTITASTRADLSRVKSKTIEEWK